MSRLFYRILLPGLLTLAASMAAQADERILSYRSEITVHRDATMTVRETIRVRAEGRKIRRGIYRDFPTRYRGRYGEQIVVGFDVRAVERDGRSEPYHTEKQRNGVRVYIGKRDTYVRRGEHTYTITYRTTRQLGFFAQHDELYWNVTGNGWEFPIDEAIALVTLPAGIPADAIKSEAYTGPFGDRGRDYQQHLDDSGRVVIVTTRPLRASHGLTIVVGWPKGFVTIPDTLTRVRWFLADNKAAIVGGLGLILVLAYYLLAWSAVGRDPAGGVIIPLFKPPQNLSPAAMRFVQNYGYDQRCFSAAVVSAAVKGAIQITETSDPGLLRRLGIGKETYELVKQSGADLSALSKGEQAVFHALFAGGSDRIALVSSNHDRIGKALEKLKTYLKTEFQKAYFATNRGWFAGGLVLSILAVVISAFLAVDGEEFVAVIFLIVWLTPWSLATFALWNSRAYTMALPFSFFALMALGFVVFLATWIIVVLLAATITINVLFYWLLRAPTLAGRRMLDQVEGFKMYLTTAEKDRLAKLHPPERTPALFEQYLPYALALGVEQQWAEQFADVLAAAGQAPGSSHYSPNWYAGRSLGRFDAGRLSSTLGGSFASAISSASTAPGSSSGGGFSGGGGGSSGGGGGGGGGGGW